MVYVKCHLNKTCKILGKQGAKIKQNLLESYNNHKLFQFFFFRKIALTVILIRAGLGLDPVALKKLSFTVLRLAFAPCLTECLVEAVAAHFLLGLPWEWGFMLG